jgi:Putative peptidoglycan binding domain
MEPNTEAESFAPGGEMESETELFMRRGTRGGRGFAGRRSVARSGGFSTRSSFRQGRQAFGRGRSFGRFRRRGQFGARPAFGPSADISSEFVSSIQSCLQQVVGAWVPQTGIMGPGTRRAIRIFQSQNGMPVTGLLDDTTVSAINSACAAPAPPEPPPGAAQAASDTGPEQPGAEMEQEQGEEEQEQEFQISDACEVHIQQHSKIPVAEEKQLAHLPRTPGVYIIYSDGKPWYVGVAERSIHERFLSRWKVLRDFNIPASVLANREVAWVSVEGGKVPACAVGRRKLGSGMPFEPLRGVHAVLKVLEQYLMKNCNTAGMGNRNVEAVQFAPGGSLKIKEGGKSVTLKCPA